MIFLQKWRFNLKGEWSIVHEPWRETSLFVLLSRNSLTTIVCARLTAVKLTSINIQGNLASARGFSDTLNNCHHSLNLTMDFEIDGKLSFLGMEAILNHNHIEMKEYIEPTNTGLPLRYHSCVDRRYNRLLNNHHAKPLFPFIILLEILF